MDEVLWTELARQDLDDIAAYIALDNPTAAENTVRRIVETVAGLSFYPRIGRKGRVEGTRELVISGTPFIAIYRLRERIEILYISRRTAVAGFGCITTSPVPDSSFRALP